MFDKLVNRVLLVNDDGIDAPGIKILENVAQKIAHEVWVVAPIIDQSGVSCSVSLKTPFRVTQRDEKRYAVYGTPADCMLFAIKHLMVDNLPDLVLSGINCGSNVGFETILSGTVGAAIMAMTLGIPAMAFSQVNTEDMQPTNWDCATHHAQEVIKKLYTLNVPDNICFNINFPCCSAKETKGMRVTKQGESDASQLVLTPTKDPEGHDYYWFRAKRNQQILGKDKELDAANNNYITITPMSYERTHYAIYEKLKQQINTDE